MNGQTITTQDLLSEIHVIEKALSDLKRKVFSFVPPKYGSDAWWEKMDNEGLEQIRQGNVVKFDSIKDLQKHLGL
jgi:hypothetical protein